MRDRLLHHAVYRILYPDFDRVFINDSYSCRKGKGVHKAVRRFQGFARKVSKNDMRTCWVLKCDVRKFFASIDQQILIRILRARVEDERVLVLLEHIIRSFHSITTGKGLPLGNLTSQLLVNVYMNEFDQYVKHTLKVPYYIRYADDFVVFSQDRDSLVKVLSCMETFLQEELKLELHPNKVYIKTLASGVDFLGWVHFPDHRVLRTATKQRMFRRIQETEATKEAVTSYLGLLRHGNTWKLQRRILNPIKIDEIQGTTEKRSKPY